MASHCAAIVSPRDEEERLPRADEDVAPRTCREWRSQRSRTPQGRETIYATTAATATTPSDIYDYYENTRELIFRPDPARVRPSPTFPSTLRRASRPSSVYANVLTSTVVAISDNTRKRGLRGTHVRRQAPVRNTPVVVGPTMTHPVLQLKFLFYFYRSHVNENSRIRISRLG